MTAFKIFNQKFSNFEVSYNFTSRVMTRAQVKRKFLTMILWLDNPLLLIYEMNFAKLMKRKSHLLLNNIRLETLLSLTILVKMTENKCLMTDFFNLKTQKKLKHKRWNFLLQSIDQTDDIKTNLSTSGIENLTMISRKGLQSLINHLLVHQTLCVKMLLKNSFEWRSWVRKYLIKSLTLFVT